MTDTNRASPAPDARSAVDAIVSLQGVVAADEAGPDGTSLGSIRGLDLVLGAGLHLVLGRPHDGTAALIEVLAGDRTPRSGRVRIDGRDPARSASLRRRIGVLGSRVELVGTTVADAVRAASIVRRSAADALERLELTYLAPRTLASLSQAEARAVELALALAVPRPLLLALFEPSLACAISRESFCERLRAIATEGAVIVIATSSPAESFGLPLTAWLLDGGRLAGGASGPLHGQGELVVWLTDADGSAARKLAAALGTRPELTLVAWQQRAHESTSVVTVGAPELELAALAIAEVASALATPIVAIRPRANDLDGLLATARATATAHIHATATAQIHAPATAQIHAPATAPSHASQAP